MIRSRSAIHLLNMAAARLELDAADPALVKALRQAATLKADKRARGEVARDADAAEEQKLIERQRTLFNILPDSQRKTALKDAMLQRSYDLLWDGDARGCDALIEFLPSDEVEAMLNAWTNDQIEPDTAKSKWH
jgi:hypothetical protein